MAMLATSEANLHRLIDEVAASHEPVIITGERHNAVLVAEEDWSAIQETLYLLSVRGMRESIHEGMATPISECSEELIGIGSLTKQSASFSL